MITKYFLICDITASPDELPKGLSFMVKASYKEEGSDSVTLETSKVSAIDILEKKIRKLKFISKCNIDKDSCTQWRFYGEDYPENGDSYYRLSGLDSCADFIYAYIASIEVAKYILLIDTSDSIIEFETIFNNRFCILETTENALKSLF